MVVIDGGEEGVIKGGGGCNKGGGGCNKGGGGANQIVYASACST